MSTSKATKTEQPSKMTNVIVIGMTKCGKSSVIRSLLNKDLIIQQGTGRKAEFKNDEIQQNGKKPLVTSDSNANLTFIEYPGFENSEGFDQEKINLFVKDQTYLNNYKILLVAIASDFEEYNDQGVEKYFEILSQKFSKNQQNLENQLGLVVTKGDIDITGVDYIEQLEDNCSNSMKKWCNFFKSNFDRVFAFPSAKRDSIGKKYEYDDQKRILQFLQSNNGASNNISDISNSNAKAKTQSPNFYKVREIVRNIFSDIFFEYRKDKSTSSLRRWLISLQQMKSRNIDDPNELKSFFQRNIPNYEQYNEYFQELEKFKDLKSYSDLQENLSSSLFEATQELESLYQQADMIEKQEEKNNELKRREEEQRQNSINQKREREEIERTMAMQRQYGEQQKDLIEMYEQTIAQNASDIERLKARNNRHHHRNSNNRNNDDDSNRDGGESTICIIE